MIQRQTYSYNSQTFFVSSTNRRIENSSATVNVHAKDRFAIEFLRKFGARRAADQHEAHGDLVVFEDV